MLKKGILVFVLILTVAGLCLMNIYPAQAQENTVNYTLTNLNDRDFSYQDLHGTSFAGATMWGANFQGANLQSTIITKGDFFRANLRGADFTETFADRVSFDETNLTNAIFTDAMLMSSTFRNADVTGTDFSGAMVDRYQIKLMCETASGKNPITGVATRESLGCS
ncbi:pentapeptide repeat-containing protein [Dapis sp. BLCC M229]|uniref:pentapeptide repeat-containing protein n=1 Tax=Dapis sp. BLCC M229 TaxID=3400188 RepID=UPI003CF32A31